MRIISVMVLALAFGGQAFAAPPQQQQQQQQRQPRQQRPGGLFGRQGQAQAVPAEESRAIGDLNQLSKQMQEIARLGVRQGTTRGIRDLATQMDKEYSQLNKDIVQFSEQNRVSLGGTPPASLAQQVQELKGLKGKAFDRAFLNLVAEENDKAVTDITELEGTSVHQGFKDQANRALPVLRKYSGEARRLQQKLGA
jgi:predicted outer membrane protein